MQYCSNTDWSVNGVNQQFFDSIVLGVVQGLTEFLPVSSSGHLVLTRAVLHIRDLPFIYDVFFHFATVLAVCTLFRSDLIGMITGTARVVTIKLFPQRNRKTKILNSNGGAKLCVFIIIGSIPAAVLGLLFADIVKQLFNDPETTAVLLIVTGILLISTVKASTKDRSVTALPACIIGIAQAIALFPGISRSGITITTGLWLGIKPVDAARFSFLVSVPVILGANLLEFSSVSWSLIQEHIWYLISGGIAAYVFGLLAIGLVMNSIKKGNFFGFGIYCILAGFTGLAFI